MKLEGDVEIIRFRNESNGYSVVVLDVDGEPVTAAGTFPPLKEGVTVSVSGEYTVHPRFGRQFAVSEAKVCLPDDTDGMVRYLGSGIIRGIGTRTALAIVNKFGSKTFEVMEKEPLKLAAIRGITRDKARQIGERFSELKNMNEAMLFMQSHGITIGISMKIYEVYKEKTVAVISSNPYRLIEDVDGVGFIRADAIAKKLGFEEGGRQRLRAGLVYTLKESCEGGGNTYLPEDELIESCLKLLGAGDEQTLSELIDDLVIDGMFKRIETENCSRGVMLRKTYRAEKGAAVALTRLLATQNAIREDVSADISEFERVSKVELAERQTEAVVLAANSGVCVITGGPGTGKTTIVKCIIGIFERRKEKVILMAPTGRAAKRLSESTGREASTIHRALARLSDSEDGEGQPLAADAVIVDEVSMMDVYLTDMLLKRLRPSARLILVGDKDQLPSVGAGNVLADLLSSGLVPSVKLDTIFRQGSESLIVTNAHRINSGEMPLLKEKDKDFFFSASPDSFSAAATVVDMASRRIPSYLKCEPYRVQVLCPMKNGACGTVALNEALRAKQNPYKGSGELRDENSVWRVGDKVMHIANNYMLEWRMDDGETGKGVFNGDLGIVTDVRGDSGEIDVRFEDGRQAVYSAEARSQLTPAYAITVHKSQGSEFDAVIIPIVGGGPMIMTRNLLYTAITRAKKMAVLVGSEYWIKRMVDNNYIQKRYSALGDFLRESIEENTLLSRL